MTRSFEDKPAKREAVPLLVGLFGPSGCGKTYSALRIATGIQRVSGGDIGFVDTEARRALHYADQFKFRHLEFKPPFGPLDYLAALQHFEKKGVKTVIVDSMSHEHEGEGGVLDQHETAMDGKSQSFSMLAWAKPKKQRRELINGILQMNCNFVFCFRAKQKMKMVKNDKGNPAPTPQGYMPIAGEEFIFEMTACALLMPRSNGVPEWNPVESGERMMTKLPEQFFSIFEDERRNPKQIDESIGEKLALWAKGNDGAAVKIAAPESESDLSLPDDLIPPISSSREIVGPIVVEDGKPGWWKVTCQGMQFAFSLANVQDAERLNSEIESSTHSTPFKIEYETKNGFHYIKRIARA